MSTIDTTTSDEPSAPQNGGVPAVVKCIAILRFLNKRGTQGASLAAIAAELALTKSHALNIMRTLVAEQWVNYKVSRRSYTLDNGLFGDLSSILGRSSRSEAVHDILVRLSRATEIPCVVSRINSDDTFIAIDKAEEGAELLVSVPVGHRFPWNAPAQLRARIAFCDSDTSARLTRKWRPHAFTPRSLKDRVSFAKEVEATRTRGYAVGRSEFRLGVMSLAAPVFDHVGNVRFILQCVGLEADLSSRELAVSEVLLPASNELSRIRT